MRNNWLKVSLFVFIYVLAFLIFKSNTFAQYSTPSSNKPTTPAATTPAATTPAATTPAAATPAAATPAKASPAAATPAAATPAATTPAAATPAAATPAATTPAAATPAKAAPTSPKQISRIEAVFETSMGSFKARLFFGEAPKTVENFVNLAEGKKDWIHPTSKAVMNGVPFYNGLEFYLVRKGIMIMTGDPNNKGTYGSGYTIPDEISRDRSHHKAGILSMGNRGKDTADSRFFITLGPLKHLDKTNSIFGEVTEGLDVVEKIGLVPVRKLDDHPKTPVVIQSIKIIRN